MLAASLLFGVMVVGGVALAASVDCQADTTCSGTSKADTITGSPGNDYILALGGNDNVNGWGGDDTLFGDAGADTVIGGEGSDNIHGMAGSPQIAVMRRSSTRVCSLKDSAQKPHIPGPDKPGPQPRP